MRLFNIANKENPILIAEITKDPQTNKEELKILSKNIAEILKNMGIAIPAVSQKNYDNKEVVYLGDNTFTAAFKNIYAATLVATNKYKWFK